MGVNNRLIIFHPALAPYRVDLFNYLIDNYNTIIYFLHKNLLEQNLDQELLVKQLKSKPSYSKLAVRFWNRTFPLDILPILILNKPLRVISTEFGFTTQQVLMYKLLFNRNLQIYLFTDDNQYDSRNRKGISKFLRNLITKRVDGVIYTSDVVASVNEKLIGHPINFFVCPIIHDHVIFKQKLKEALVESNNLIQQYDLNGKKVLISVGRLVESKNILSFLLSLKNVNLDEVVVFVIGDGPQLNLLKLKAKELSLNVIFTGKLQGLQLLAFYNIAQILVFPSVNEPFGAVVGEALLGGAKVICSNMAGSASLISETNGVIIDPFNQNEISSNINFLLKDCDSNPKIIKSVRESLLDVDLKSCLTTITSTWQN